MDIEKVRRFVIPKLETELKPNLYYHGVEHTIDVCDAALRIGASEGCTKQELILLETAALFHDIGILWVYKGHECKSAEYAKEKLHEMDFSENEINQISEMILATQLPQKPKDKLSEILCDADLDYLGRNDFYITSFCLYREWEELGNKMSLKEWYELQISFLSNHNYFTKTSFNLRQERKRFYINQIKEIINK